MLSFCLSGSIPFKWFPRYDMDNWGLDAKVTQCHNYCHPTDLVTPLSKPNSSQDIRRTCSILENLRFYIFDILIVLYDSNSSKLNFKSNPYQNHIRFKTMTSISNFDIKIILLTFISNIDLKIIFLTSISNIDLKIIFLTSI